MKKETPEQILENYLREIEGELGGVPSYAKEEFLSEIRSHLMDEWQHTEEKNTASLLNILQRFGDPREIAGEFKERTIEPAQPRTGGYIPTWLVLVLTVVIWPVGIVLAWFSPAWHVKDKVIATLIPLVLLALILAASFTTYHRYREVQPGPVEITNTEIEEIRKGDLILQPGGEGN